PWLTDQWYVDAKTLARPALAAVREGRTVFTPKNWEKTYFDWLENIQPWCVSRQLWWGHRIPIYTCDNCGKAVAARATPDVCGACGAKTFTQDPDVLDTWFSSALWPFATLGWPEQTPELAAFYPTDVLSTARDILFLWVARMIMMGLELTGRVPFSDVYIHSIIQAPDGRRMSKSLGTGIDPLEQIAEHGADALRFGLLAMSSTQDVRYSPEKVKQGQALANKLYNAVRFVLGAVGGRLAQDGGGEGARGEPSAAPGPDRTRAIEDRWILSRLERARAEQARRIERFDFSHAALGLYDFVYGELCDWYLELVKPRLAGAGEGAGDGLSALLVHLMRETVALAHPVIPFVTEELWPHLGGHGLLAGSFYPTAREDLLDGEAEAALGRAIEAVESIRGWRDMAGARPGAPLPARLRAEGYELTASALARLARVELEPTGSAGGAAVASVSIPGGALEVLSAEGLDLEGAERRLSAARERLLGEIERVQAKLANGRFTERAPAEVVAAEREKLTRLQGELAVM
ncbi:MAG: class I tRNA ligase family protein, partial [Acidobacteriota bacterium]|nr:class I tRNA ligase family protein [Acidobacteriota bacterium]